MTWGYVYVAFQIWMLIDAIRRRVEFYWYLIIIFVPVFGTFAYFFMVKAHDFDLARFGLARRGRPPRLADLEVAAQESPSVANQLALADALYGTKRFAEAAQRYQQIIDGAPTEKAALHGLGRAQLGLGQASEAIDTLLRLGDLDNSYRDYAAVLDLAEALWSAGRRAQCIELLEALVAQSSRINHKVALAHYSREDERAGRAREVLELALAEFERAPDFVKRRDRVWADRAEKMLRALG